MKKAQNKQVASSKISQEELRHEQTMGILKVESSKNVKEIIGKVLSPHVVWGAVFIILIFKQPDKLDKVLDIVHDNLLSDAYLSLSIALNVLLGTIILYKNSTANSQKERLGEIRVLKETNDPYNTSSELDKYGNSEYDRK